ncbi:hypothetical protein SAMN04488066_10611 [Halorubrum aquaticum]|uniref:Uncharacterized protein n=2 Tax=Halorubrum aquaticum TaxID=387340 RepID=A0A1I3AKE2_9EURY|nr:hypothetical protein SAMN04488066_10611 [Halorubrum aquaticum]
MSVMENLSDHTLQINAWIGLCQLDRTFPDALRNLGYTVDIIDPSFVHEGDSVNPDLILTSRAHNHSIIIDCKSYFIKEEQNQKYESIHHSPEVLLTRGIVSAADATEDFDAEFSYSSFEDLNENPHLPENDFAVVHFDEDANQYIIRTLDNYEFNLVDLQDEFPIFTNTRRLPTDYFPFDVGTGDDDYRQFTISILQSTVHVALKQNTFDADDLLENAHPLWIDLDNNLKNELRAHTETILTEYQLQGLDEHIEKVQAGRKDEWRVVSKSLQALQRKVDGFVDDVQEKLEQTSLDDFE